MGDEIKPYPLGREIGALSADIRNLNNQFKSDMKKFNKTVTDMSYKIDALSEKVAKLEQARDDDVKFANMSLGMKATIAGALMTGLFTLVDLIVHRMW